VRHDHAPPSEQEALGRTSPAKIGFERRDGGAIYTCNAFEPRRRPHQTPGQQCHRLGHEYVGRPAQQVRQVVVDADIERGVA
jgi:hypothetical protein